MKFEDIFTEWDRDSKIDKTELADEAVKIPKLHHRYYTYYVGERAVLRRLEAEMKQLHLAKHEFYTQGPNEESREKGWVYPASGVILKADVPMYIEADKDIIDLSLRIGNQQEKVEMLSQIIKSLTNRGYLLKTMLDHTKFIMGG